MAARGSRHLTANVENIDDPMELAQVRRQARTIQIKAVLAATALTFMALLVPQPQRWKARVEQP